MSYPYFNLQVLLMKYTSDKNWGHFNKLLADHWDNRIKIAKGSSHNHQAWEGGYAHHVVETMNIAIWLYNTSPRPLPFALSDATEVMFLHDLEKPWKHTKLNKNPLECICGHLLDNHWPDNGCYNCINCRANKLLCEFCKMPIHEANETKEMCLSPWYHNHGTQSPICDDGKTRAVCTPPCTKFVSVNPLVEMGTKQDRRNFRNMTIRQYGIQLTDAQWNALDYVEGENDDYTPEERIMGELAAFCHACDILSARLWHDKGNEGAW